MVDPEMKQVVEISPEHLKRVVKEGKPVVIEFWIKSCGNCQKFRPIYEQLPNIFGSKAEFFKMNVYLNLQNLKYAENLGLEARMTISAFAVYFPFQYTKGYPLPHPEIQHKTSQVINP